MKVWIFSDSKKDVLFVASSPATGLGLMKDRFGSVELVDGTDKPEAKAYQVDGADGQVIEAVQMKVDMLEGKAPKTAAEQVEETGEVEECSGQEEDCGDTRLDRLAIDDDDEEEAPDEFGSDE